MKSKLMKHDLMKHKGSESKWVEATKMVEPTFKKYPPPLKPYISEDPGEKKTVDHIQRVDDKYRNRTKAK